MLERLFFYELTDLIAFSQQTYVHLLSAYQATIPIVIQLVVPLACIGLVLGIQQPVLRQILLVYLGLQQIWVGWLFYAQAFAPLSWHAQYIGYAMLLQGGLIWGVLCFSTSASQPIARRQQLVLLFVVLLPMEVLYGGQLRADLWLLFGVGPESTHCMALVFLSCLFAGWQRWLLLPIPALLLVLDVFMWIGLHSR